MTRQLTLPFPPADAYLEPFIAAACNGAALAWLDRPQDWPDGRLVVAGARGLGKTHFARTAAARHGTLWTGASLGDVLRPPAFLVVDDADCAPEQALLHLLNAAWERGGTILLTMALAPSHASFALPDLVSRLRAATVATLEPPDDALLAAILLGACAARQLAVAAAIQDYLRIRLPRTADAMREVAARLDHAAMSAGRTVTRPLAASVLRTFGCHTDADDTQPPVRYATHTLFPGGPP